MLHGCDEETAIETKTCSHAHVLWLEHHTLCTQITPTLTRWNVNNDHSVCGKGTEWWDHNLCGKGLKGEITMYMARDWTANGEISVYSTELNVTIWVSAANGLNNTAWISGKWTECYDLSLYGEWTEWYYLNVFRKWMECYDSSVCGKWTECYDLSVCG